MSDAMPDRSASAAGKAGGLAVWSIRHPVSIGMLALAVTVIGVLTYQHLSVALLPDIMYPGIRVRILDPGVSARIMEDGVTRQLEEQLAITEDAVGVQSRTAEGQTSVDLSFQYGKDIDIALRDASTRLDRARRFLPDSIRPPIIYKFDPSQIPIAEFVVASALRDPVELRDWVDYVFSKWFVNLPGVAAVEVGGGLVREIQILPDPVRLGGLGLSVNDVVTALERSNIEEAAGRMESRNREYIGRTSGKFRTVEQIGMLPVQLPDKGVVRLRDVAEVVDSHENDRLRVRLDGQPGVKVAIQKQPLANTVGVVDEVNARLRWLTENKLMPSDLTIEPVADQSMYIRHALRNASQAALGGATLAMLVVYLFLGDIRRTLVVGTAIPLSILVTFALMDAAGLTLNIMSLGGLALGVGMVVDSTIVMLENVYRHQRMGKTPLAAGRDAAAEVNSAIVASTSTNLAAIVPFLFVSGLVGLMFKELILTITAAIIASMIVALTLVPAFGSRVPTGRPSRIRTIVDRTMTYLQDAYARFLRGLLTNGWMKTLVVTVLTALLAFGIFSLQNAKEIFLPSLDDGLIRVDVVADPGIPIDAMDENVQKFEALFQNQPEVHTVFTIVGGRIFGRSQRETSNRTTMSVQLVPVDRRDVSADAWVKRMRAAIRKLRIAGFKVRMRTGRIRGVRANRGNDDVTLRLTGFDQEVMDRIGFQIVERIRDIPGLRNVTHSAEEKHEELVFQIDHDRLAELGFSVEQVARAARLALEGVEVTKFLENDRSYNIRVRLPQRSTDTVQALDSVLISAGVGGSGPVYLSDVAAVRLVSSPAVILRDNQRRITEVNASLDESGALADISKEIDARIAGLELPDGYSIYNAGAVQSLQEGRNLTFILLGLALFLVFVVMAVQYESLRNPFIILLGVPFTITGVALGLLVLEMPLSMPVWLGMIMLAGIVVNNAIVLIEFIEILRSRGMSRLDAVVEAGRVRLRPILMTTLTTVCGLLPLSLGLGEGAEMLQPLAITIVFGLTFSMLVTLLFMPIIFSLIGAREPSMEAAKPVPAE
ncbi:MAG: efflux RND transporter permease subunit [Alphaproteobacteria bacterium]|nr:efflux RND transporter permease subunit [Alphaproteobacteria bacterium]